MLKYIAFDIETTGLIKKKSSLLTAYFCFLNENLQKEDELELAIKPDNGAPYFYNPKAMAVNRINLIEHDKIAIPLKEAKEKFKEKLDSLNIEKLLIPIGHNFHFDVKFIKYYLSQDWDKKVARRGLDTSVIAQWLKFSNRVPINFPEDLQSIAEEFKLVTNNVSHTAKGDTEITIKVLNKLKLNYGVL